MILLAGAATPHSVPPPAPSPYIAHAGALRKFNSTQRCFFFLLFFFGAKRNSVWLDGQLTPRARSSRWNCLYTRYMLCRDPRTRAGKRIPPVQLRTGTLLWSRAICTKGRLPADSSAAPPLSDGLSCRTVCFPWMVLHTYVCRVTTRVYRRTWCPRRGYLREWYIQVVTDRQ